MLKLGNFDTFDTQILTGLRGGGRCTKTLQSVTSLNPCYVSQVYLKFYLKLGNQTMVHEDLIINRLFKIVLMKHLLDFAYVRKHHGFYIEMNIV